MLRLITAWSSDALADWLADWYSASSADPFQREMVVIPTPGMERFVTRRLARRLGVSDPQAADGVCAAIDFTQPQDLMAAVLMDAMDGEDDPWLPAVLQWHCLRAIDELVGRPDERLVGLRHHLRDGTRDVRRMGVAREVAHLLDSYAVQRPDLLLAWAEGDTTQTPVQYRWQADVFRHVLEETGTAPWPLRVRDLLADGLGDVDVPPRVAVFGVTRYGALEQQFLEALARDREVAVLMVEHSPGHADTTSGVDDTNDLVETLGKEELFALRTLEAMQSARKRLPGYPEPTATLLSRLQASIAGDLPLRGGPAESGDDSLTIHGCAGALRQVEVLRDQVLGLLQKDASLQARDVLVMCTDLDVYAPLIAQVFGTSSAPVDGPTRDLRVSVADRVARIDNPVLQVVQTFVGLLATRMTAPEVLDLMELPAVADRFGLDAETHSRVERLVTDAGVRWGLDSDHRLSFGVDAGATNTWRAGVDRLVAGLAVDGSDPVLMHGIAPTEGSADRDVALVAALDEIVATLHDAWRFARSPHPARDWAAAVAGWVEPLVGGDAQWRSAAAMAVVSQALDGDDQIRLGEVTTLLDAELARYGPRPRLLAGGVDVVAMRPMRNIPFRVVCLLGMDDGAFPRSVTLGGNDLLAVDPRPGERDPRAEDRQLFLDAVCAAQQHLVITYSSVNPTSGNPLPPAAPLAQLLDSVGDVVHQHPLVAHDPRNFATDPRGAIAPSVDRTAAALATADAPSEEPLRDARVGVVSTDLTLDDLLAFWKNPAKAFIRSMGLPIEGEDELDDHELTIDLDGLQKWKLGDSVLRSGRDLSAAHSLAVARGDLPVVRPDATWDEIAGKVQRLREAAERLETGEPGYTHLELPLSREGGVALTAVLAHRTGGQIVDVSYSGLKSSDVLAMRIRVAALSAAGTPCTGILIRSNKGSVRMHRERPSEQSQAAQWLRRMAILREIGLGRPLAFAAETSAAYAKQLPDVHEAIADAVKAWEGSFFVPGDRTATENQLLWDSDWRTLTAVSPLDHDWLPHRGPMFAQLAEFVFGGLP